MYLPGSFSAALVLTVLSAVFWGSWANTFKGTRNYPFELFYWDYILGVVLCAFAFAFTLGSSGGSGESFLANLHAAEPANWVFALAAGAIFNVANVLLVAAIAIAGLAVAFPVAIGIALVEGVVLSYVLQPKGNVAYLFIGVALAFIAILMNARAYRLLSAASTESRSAPAARAAQDQTSGGRSRASSMLGIWVSIIAGLLMGAFAPFITRAMTTGHPLTPYSAVALFSVGALLCCFIFNVFLMKHPIQGHPVKFSGFWSAGFRNHALGVIGGIAWGIGGCTNFIAAGLVGVPISYAIGQSAPLIAAAWGVWVWHEFDGAPKAAWRSLGLMFVFYVAAISFIASAYNR